MKASIYTTAVLLALGLTACNKEMDNPLADGPVALSVTADISQVVTRATATAFENEDPIGIFPKKNDVLDAEQANRLYTYNGSTFTSADPYYFQDRGMVTFNAYYPYDVALTAENYFLYGRQCVQPCHDPSGVRVQCRDG